MCPQDGLAALLVGRCKLQNYRPLSGEQSLGRLPQGKLAREASKAIERVVQWQPKAAGKQLQERRRTSTFSDKDGAKTGIHAAENGNEDAVRHFRIKYPDLGESIIRSFKASIFSRWKSAEKGDITAVTSIPSKMQANHLLLVTWTHTFSRFCLRNFFLSRTFL